MRKELRLLGYEIRNAWISLRRHWLLALSTVITTALCLSLIAFFFIIGSHLNSFSSQMMEEISIHAIVKDGTEDEKELSAIRRRLENIEGVDSVTFSSKDHELEIMIAEKGSVFSRYRGQENPLNNAFFISVQDQDMLETVANRVKRVAGIKEVFYGGHNASSMVSLLKTIQRFSLLFIAALVLLALYLIYSTIKTSLDSRQSEIAIQKTVGADVNFIRRPFEIEGMALGLAGALIPLVLIILFYPMLYRSLGGVLFLRSLRLQDPIVLVSWLFIVLILLGLAMGFLASFMVVHKYLKTTR